MRERKLKRLSAKARARVNNFYEKTLTIRNRKNSKRQYYIEFRWLDYSFSWLPHWNKPGNYDIWYMIENYTWEIVEWISDYYGVHLVNSSLGRIFQFFLDTGLVIIKGDPPNYSKYKLEVAIRSVLEQIESSYTNKG